MFPREKRRLPLHNPFDYTNELHGVSCGAPSLCIAVEDRGNVLRSTDPQARGRRVWRLTSVDELHALHGISCASASMYVAVDDHRYAFVGHLGGT
jgi:hypothetical protein